MRAGADAVVLIPGIVCDDAVWAAQVGALRSERPVIVVDHRERDSLVDMARAAIAPDRSTSPLAMACTARSISPGAAPLRR